MLQGRNVSRLVELCDGRIKMLGDTLFRMLASNSKGFNSSGKDDGGPVGGFRIQCNP